VIGRIPLVGRTYRHINRYREIAAVLIRHGFGDFLATTNLEKYIDLGKRIISSKKTPPAAKTLSRAERIRMALEELGPTFIKFGQIMSNRPDLLPPDLIRELEKLQDAAPPFPEEESRRLIEQELGAPVGEIFRDFDPTPIACASIAQVHKAALRSGETVIVKVQRPRIEQTVETDIEIMLHLAALSQKHIQAAAALDPVGIVREFQRSIRKELDFTTEAVHIQRFRRNFLGDPTVYVPKVYRNLTTHKVLTMEFVEGIKISDIEALRRSTVDPKVIARRGADFVLKQVFEHGFFHADLHPGNILILEGDVLCPLDFGMMGSLSEKQRRQLGDIIVGIVYRDHRRVCRTLIQMSRDKQVEDADRLERDVTEFIERYAYLPLDEIRLRDLFADLINLIAGSGLKVPPDIYLLIKALVTLEGVGRMLDPEFNSTEHVRPFAEKLARHRLSPGALAKDIYLSASELAFLLRDLPGETREIIEQIKNGRIKVELEHKGLESLLRTHDRISNRIAFAIVLASLIIGSSLIVRSGIPPIWHGLPLIGIAGFLAAGIIGFWLILSILKHGKM